MRRMVMLLAAVVATAAVASGLALGGGRDDGSNRKSFEYAIGLWGDLPYSSVQAAALPNLIADMNNQELAFTAHDGDLKAGSGSPCDNALYQTALGWFGSLDAPAVFTPGDNDWTDCDRDSNGGFNSLERLDHERSLFFATPFTLGRHRLRQEVQTDPTCLGYVAGDRTGTTAYKNVACLENRRWTVGRVTYATLDVQGSCNNLCDTSPDPKEEAARNAADIAWLHATFAEAKQRHSAAVMLIAQADPGWDLSDGTRAPLRDPKSLAETDTNPDGYQSFLSALRDEVTAFERPVAYVNGDSHYFRVDKPLENALGQRLENFTRVETFGDHQENGTNDVNWLKVLVDPESREVFAYEPQIVPANRVAVPAPPVGGER
jgi:hypothetical protein